MDGTREITIRDYNKNGQAKGDPYLIDPNSQQYSSKILSSNDSLKDNEVTLRKRQSTIVNSSNIKNQEKRISEPLARNEESIKNEQERLLRSLGTSSLRLPSEKVSFKLAQESANDKFSVSSTTLENTTNNQSSIQNKLQVAFNISHQSTGSISKSELREKLLKAKELTDLIKKYQSQVSSLPYKTKRSNSKRKVGDNQQTLEITTEEWLKLLMKTDLSYMSYHHFRYLIKQEAIYNPLAKLLAESHGTVNDGKGGVMKIGLLQLEDVLQRSDKDQFIQFRDNTISYDQLHARIASRMGVAEYKILDDIKKDLHPTIIEDLDKYGKVMDLLYKGKDKLDHKDILKPLQDWQVNYRCLKGIQYHHQKDTNANQSLWDRELKKEDAHKILFLKVVQGKDPQFFETKVVKAQTNKDVKKKRKINIGPPNNRKYDDYSISPEAIQRYESLPAKIAKQFQNAVFITQDYEGKSQSLKRIENKVIRDKKILASIINEKSNEEDSSKLQKRSQFKRKKSSTQNQDLEILIKLRKKQEREYQEKKLGLIFIKNLQQHGSNLQVNKHISDFLEIKDEVELAMQEDMKSDNDELEKLALSHIESDSNILMSIRSQRKTRNKTNEHSNLDKTFQERTSKLLPNEQSQSDLCSMKNINHSFKFNSNSRLTLGEQETSAKNYEELKLQRLRNNITRNKLMSKASFMASQNINNLSTLQPSDSFGNLDQSHITLQNVAAYAQNFSQNKIGIKSINSNATLNQRGQILYKRLDVSKSPEISLFDNKILQSRTQTKLRNLNNTSNLREISKLDTQPALTFNDSIKTLHGKDSHHKL